MKTTHNASVDRRSFLAGTGAVAAGLTFGPGSLFAAEDAKVNFYNWDTYIGEDTLPQFTKATGIDVTMDLYADNDELFAKLKEGNPGYDLIVPTNDFVERMILAKMLEPIDHEQLKNFSNIDPVFQDATFDPGRKYSIPYMWGTIGIGYRKSKVDGVPDSWKWLYDSNRYSGRISLLGDGLTVIQQALKYLGYSMNTTDAAQIKRAEELIIKQKPNIKVFAEDNGQDLLLSGEVDICQEWNGDILQVMTEDDDIGFVVPNEGGLLWQDSLCVPTDAPHPGNAHKLIDYILDAKVGAEIADYIQYATANSAAKALMSDEYTKNPAIFPTDDVIRNSEPSIYLGVEHTRLIDETWTRIQAA